MLQIMSKGTNLTNMFHPLLPVIILGKVSIVKQMTCAYLIFYTLSYWEINHQQSCQDSHYNEGVAAAAVFYFFDMMDDSKTLHLDAAEKLVLQTNNNFNYQKDNKKSHARNAIGTRERGLVTQSELTKT